MRLPLLAICLIAVAALTVAVALPGGAPGAAMTSADACYLPTPAPSSTPLPNNSISLCNMTGQTADGVEFYVGSPMFVQPLIAVNAAGCETPSATADESPPDFTNKITVTWPSVCVGPGAAVEIAFDCSHLDDTPTPCQPALGCVSWTVAGQPLGSPCPTPDCGGVPCCNGLPCPTASPPPPTNCPEPTPTPSLQYYPSFCNDTGKAVDSLEFFETSPYQSVEVQLASNPPGCPDPAISSPGEMAPDFSYGFTIDWPNACVQPFESVQISFSCDHGADATLAPCELGAACAGWTLVGKPVGQPCEPPGCGNVPCCSGLPCPTPRPPTPDTDHDGIPDAYDNCPTVPNPAQRNRGSDGLGDLCNTPPGDLDCNFLVQPADLLTLLYDLGGVPHNTSQLCTEIAAGRTRPLADLNCDGTVGAADLVRLLRYEGGLPIDEIAGCPAIGG